MAVDWSGTAPGVASSVASITQAIAAIQNMKFQRLLQLASEQREDRLRQEDRAYNAGLLADERGWRESQYDKARKDALADEERMDQKEEDNLLMAVGQYEGPDQEKRALSAIYSKERAKAEGYANEERDMRRNEFGLRQKESEVRLQQIQQEIDIRRQQFEDYQGDREKQEKIKADVARLVAEYNTVIGSLNEEPAYEEIPAVYRLMANTTMPGPNNLPMYSTRGIQIGNLSNSPDVGGNARTGFSMDVPDRVGQAYKYWKDANPDSYNKAVQLANEKRAYKATADLRNALLAIGAYDPNKYMEDPLGTAINMNPSILPRLSLQTWGR